jgi:hypothetical protein
MGVNIEPSGDRVIASILSSTGPMSVYCLMSSPPFNLLSSGQATLPLLWSVMGRLARLARLARPLPPGMPRPPPLSTSFGPCAECGTVTCMYCTVRGTEAIVLRQGTFATVVYFVVRKTPGCRLHHDGTAVRGVPNSFVQ